MLIYSSDKYLNIQDVVGVFNNLFQESENTVLEWGATEAIYLPADLNNRLHRVVAREDFYASALHELAHWCIAGKERRKQVDYGYWYYPDGRTPAQQTVFESVEVKPQALEWILAQACGLRFRISNDNLDGYTRDSIYFANQVYEQAHYYLSNGFPPRGITLIKALAEFYGRGCYLHPRFFLKETI